MFSTHGAAVSALPVAPSPREAYAFALAAERGRAPLTAPGHRLYWMAGGAVGCRDLPATPEAFLVFGRHTNCGVALDRDPRLSLRHLLVRSVKLDDGSVVLSAMDLKTELGLTLPNGSNHRSIAAAGPVVLSMGGYALVALPSGHAPPLELPPAEVDACEEAPLGAHPYRAPATSKSRITLMPNLLDLGERRAPSNDHESEVGRYELRLESPHGTVSLRLSERALDAGVLVGRAPKCVHAGLGGVLSSGVSRVHALLLRTRSGDVFAYDVASTQGMYTWGQRVRVMPLFDGAQVHLGLDTGIAMVWRKR